MSILSNLSKAVLRKGAAICFTLVCALCFIPPIAAQPTGLRDFNPPSRKLMTGETQKKVDELSERIIKDNRDTALYRERLRLFQNLMELNFDNNDWTVYADKFEADLSRIIELDETAENYLSRGNWFSERLRRSQPPEKIAELYPDNQYVDKAVSDYLKAIQLDSNPKNLVSVYTNLGGLYGIRPQKLVTAPNFQTWRTEIPLKLVENDLDNAVNYCLKAVEIGAKLPYADVLRENLATTYMINMDAAVKLKAYQTALKFYEAGKIYFALKTSQCAYYAAWGNIYLELKQFDKAIETFNVVSNTADARCVDLFANRGDAFAAKGEYQQALPDYNKALTLDENDSLRRKGWLYVKRAKLFLKTGRSDQALADLNEAIEKKYIAACPQVYEIRAEAYQKLGKPALAVSDEQIASKLKNLPNCP